MKLFRVTFKEDMICGRATVQFVNAKDKSEAKRKALQRGTKHIYWDICEVEEIDESEEVEDAKYKWKSKTMGNIVCTFGDVIRQVWDSLIHYHTLDIRWEYNKNGF